MLSGYLESILQNSNAGTITEIFLWLIVSTLCISFVLLRVGKEPNVVSYAPTLLTSLGILGTFVGIVVGLMAFDATDIDGSISLLLAGLKTAFITSLVGMACSIFYKVVLSTGLLERKAKAASELSAEDIGASHIFDAIKEQSVALTELKQVIAGEDEDTVVGQIKLQRSDSNDHLKALIKHADNNHEQMELLVKLAKHQRQNFMTFSDKLWAQMETFAEMLSKSATEQVINALKEVIKDFNNQLTEQFGENFKQLNAAVLSLVDWQENYRHQLVQMMDQYAQGVEAITKTEGSVANISEKSSLIPANMDQLKTVLETNQHQLAELERHLEVFRDMRDRAVEAVPEIRQQVDKTIQEISQCVEATNSHYNQLLEDSDVYLKQYSDASKNVVDQFIDSTKQGIQSVNHGFEEGVKLIGDGLKDSSNHISEIIVNGADGFDKAVQATNVSLQNMSGALNSRTEEMSQTMEDTVSDVNSHMRAMIGDIKDQSKAVSDELSSGGVAVRKAITDGIAGISDTGQQVQRAHGEAQQRLLGYLESSNERMQGHMREQHDKQSQQMQTFFKLLETAITEAASRTGESINVQLEGSIRAIEQEIETAMNSMGGSLTQVTGRFTQDYQGLVSQMSKVVKTELTS